MSITSNGQPKKVAVFTGNRADYGLLVPLLKSLDADPLLELYLLAGGEHLLRNTLVEIRDDGFTLAGKFSFDSDLPDAYSLRMSEITAETQKQASHWFYLHRPDLVVLLGDRYETFGVAQAAFFHGIPLAHIGGGDITTGGCVDDVLRDVISDLSALHFVISESSKERLIQRGFNSASVFVTGSPVIDNLLQTPLRDKNSLCKEVGFNPEQPITLLTQHPIPAEGLATVEYFEQTLQALEQLSLEKNLQVIATYPNTDGFGRELEAVIEHWRSSKRMRWMPSLGRIGYLSWMAACDVVVGNSSSGLIETPFFKKASVTVGPRQRGRLRDRNVIESAYGADAVKTAVEKALFDTAFQKQLEQVGAVFGEKPSAPMMMGAIRSYLTLGITPATCRV